MAVYKYSIALSLEFPIIRIVCPHCHASLATVELEHATLGGRACLVCPECSSVLLSETLESESHSLEEHYPDVTFTHA